MNKPSGPCSNGVIIKTRKTSILLHHCDEICRRAGWICQSATFLKHLCWGGWSAPLWVWSLYSSMFPEVKVVANVGGNRRSSLERPLPRRWWRCERVGRTDPCTLSLGAPQRACIKKDNSSQNARLTRRWAQVLINYQSERCRKTANLGSN